MTSVFRTEKLNLPSINFSRAFVLLGLCFLVTGLLFACMATQVFAEETAESLTQVSRPLSQTGTPTYQPLVGIPGVDNVVSNFGVYINQLYYLAISLAALLAVIKIIFAGVQYMLTDLGTSKQAAKTDIYGALLGLLLILSAFLILTTINPSLANLNALSGAPALRLQNPPPGSNLPRVRTLTPSEIIRPPETPGVTITRPTAAGGAFVPADMNREAFNCRQASQDQPAGTATYTIRWCRGVQPCPTETVTTAPVSAHLLATGKEVIEITCTRPTQ